MKFYNKFSFKLVCSVLALSMIPLVVTMILSYNISKFVVTDKINQLNSAIVEGYKSGIGESIEGAVSSIKAASMSDNVIEMNAALIGHELLDIVETNAVITQIYLMDTSGMQIYKSSGELGDRSDREYFQKAVKGESNFSDVIISSSTGIPIIVYAIPVYENGDIIGVLGASVDLSFVENLISSHIDGQGSYGYVVDNNGVVLAHPDSSLMTERVNLTYLDPVADVLKGSKDSMVYTYENVTKLASYEQFEMTQWGIIYQQPIGVAYSSINNMLRIFLMITVFTMVVVTIATILFSRGVNKPIKDIENGMKKASEGNMTIQLKPELLSRKDEFGYLACDFRDMIQSLRVLLSESVELSDQVRNVAVKLAATSDHTKALSNEITNAVDEIANGASEQAHESEKGVEVTSNFSEKFIELAEKSKSMHSNVDTVISVNENGFEKVQALDEASDKNVVMTGRVEASIKELDEKSASITEILETITSIAEQTNLLALNASIEAARAGEYGRGFAVVADEIRKLAEGSKDATDAIGLIISSIQLEIRNSVESMAEVSDSSKFQSDSVLAVTEAFKRIDDSIKAISVDIRDIDTSVSQLNQENVLVVDAISNISAVSEETAAAAQQVAASVEQQYTSIEEVADESAELQALAVSLKDEIEKFEL